MPSKLSVYFNSLQKTNSESNQIKTFANIRLNVAKIMISVCDRVEYIVGKGENVDYQHFHLFTQCFQNLFFSRDIKTWDCVVKSLSHNPPKKYMNHASLPNDSGRC